MYSKKFWQQARALLYPEFDLSRKGQIRDLWSGKPSHESINGTDGQVRPHLWVPKRGR